MIFEWSDVAGKTLFRVFFLYHNFVTSLFVH